MQNIFRNMYNRKKGNQTIVEVAQIQPEEERHLFLPIASDALNITEQYNQIMFFYEAGIRQITAKLEILNREFQACNDRNPIESIHHGYRGLKSGMSVYFRCLSYSGTAFEAGRYKKMWKYS